jgi:hypothetical protein
MMSDREKALEWIENPETNPLPPKMPGDQLRANMPVSVYKTIRAALEEPEWRDKLKGATAWNMSYGHGSYRVQVCIPDGKSIFAGVGASIEEAVEDAVSQISPPKGKTP